VAVLGFSPAFRPFEREDGRERRSRSKKKYACRNGQKEEVEMKNLPQVQLNTRVSPQTWTALDEYSKKTGESKASIVDAALREYLKRKNSK
jgi:hypothetical protein